jgi:hypothetical protein
MPFELLDLLSLTASRCQTVSSYDAEVNSISSERRQHSETFIMLIFTGSKNALRYMIKEIVDLIPEVDVQSSVLKPELDFCTIQRRKIMQFRPFKKVVYFVGIGLILLYLSSHIGYLSSQSVS